MKFDEAVNGVGTLTDLRRIAGAHVVDNRQLADDELREAIVRVRPQYLHAETVASNLEDCFFRSPNNDTRILSRLVLADVLLNEYGFLLPTDQTEEKVLAQEQAIIDRSNEINLLDLAGGNKDSQRSHDIDMYSFVLGVAWDHEDSKTPDEVNLLRKLRLRLQITESDHRLLEAKLGRYPKLANALHTRSEINDVRRHLHSLGLLFSVRQDDGIDLDVIPEELAAILRQLFDIEMRAESYSQLMSYRSLHRKEHLTEVLRNCHVEHGRYDTVEVLVGRVLEYVPPSKAVAVTSPTRYGLSSDDLGKWCRELHLSPYGSVAERVATIITHFDELRPSIDMEVDERARWYEFYEELASRNYDLLRSQHVIDKDLEIEAKFEDATRYLFSEKLKHSPLQQRGSNHADGLLSLQANYLMWDNKSKEGPVRLTDHIAQFDDYMNKSEKPVPVFIVIGPEFTDDSEAEALRYHAKHIDRNLALITAKDLRLLAEEWSSAGNKSRDESFPLGLLSSTGRFDRRRLGRLF